MNLKLHVISIATALALSGPIAVAAGESPSSPSLVGILYKQFDAMKTLFVEHQQRVQAKLDQFQKVLDAPSPNAVKDSAVGIHVGDWKGNTPDHLENGYDDDPDSPTGWGITQTPGNVGWYVIDLKKVHRGLVTLKVGVNADNSPMVGLYTLWGSQDGIHWFKSWETDGWHMPGETVLNITAAMETRWVKLQAHDLGQGRAWARIYDIRFTEIN